jgi:hypothetical protein
MHLVPTYYYLLFSSPYILTQGRKTGFVVAASGG